MSFTSAVSSQPNFKPVWVPPTTTIYSLPSKVCSFSLLQGNPTGFHGKGLCRRSCGREECFGHSVGRGKGKRMGASMPKQYLPLLGQPIALYSLYTFAQMVEVKEIVVVCDPSYRDIFEEAQSQTEVVLKFALPGKERQDSVYSGLQEVDSNSALVCVHDSARPLLLSADVRKVFKNGAENGAAVLGVPVKATIKERGT